MILNLQQIINESVKKHFILMLCLLACLQTMAMEPKQYYKLLNEAISDISGNHFVEAYKKYKLICTDKKPLAKRRDYRNMYKCAVLSNDQYLLNDFYKSNFNYAFIYENKRVGLLNAAYNIDTSIHKKATSDNSITEYEKEMNRIVDSLMTKDQEARRKCPGYAKACIADVRTNDFSSANLLLNIINDNRFKFETTLSENNIYNLMVMLKHWRQWGITSFDASLKKATKDANFPPDWYADLMDYRSGVDSVDIKYKDSPKYAHEGQCFTFIDTMIVYRIKDSLYNKVDSNRNEVGFINLKTERELRWFMQKNKYFAPADFGMMVMMFGMGRNAYMPMIEKLKAKNEIY